MCTGTGGPEGFLGIPNVFPWGIGMWDLLFAGRKNESSGRGCGLGLKGWVTGLTVGRKSSLDCSAEPRFCIVWKGGGLGFELRWGFEDFLGISVFLEFYVCACRAKLTLK